MHCHSDIPVVHLRGYDVAGPHEDVVVPVALLVAVSPLVNECFSPNQLSVYLSPIIILPSVSAKDLKAVAEILVTGKSIDGDVERLKAIEEVFRMLGAVASLRMEMCSGEADQFKELQGNNCRLYDKTIELTFDDVNKYEEPMEGENTKLEISVEVETFGRPGDLSVNDDAPVDLLVGVPTKPDIEIERSVCGICLKYFKDLFLHIKSVHERIDLKKKFCCPGCKSSISYKNYSRHLRESHQKIKSSCPECGKHVTGSNIGQHMKTVHRIK